ncbi:O-antigen ligase family protein [Hymenobacter convexus]|uniref:O-antigen ligase family protein n=1 Tax=Hymenobacter sp. CA1UV-4 TaxID=3063782 RepID=UPI002713948E|nr:O-antigen ligase family protein [Hymenobacter sp. CA1UV-4]MDO7853787.1 O-antigen ligase family protein [Hymenobacter sp. CA1UV-4]
MNPSVTNLWHRLRQSFDGAQLLFMAFVGLLLVSGAAAALTRLPALLLPAALAVGLLVVLVEWRWVYYLLFFLLPFSEEISLFGGLSMDVPSEPLMLALTGCVGAALLLGAGRIPRREWLNPLLIILGLMLLWTAVDAFFSVDTLKSVKYLLAKVWYLTPFVLGTLLIVRRPADAWRFAAFYATGACLSVMYVVSRHATKGFSFADINWALRPFFRNHVIYATMLALLIPFCWFAMRAATKVGPKIAWRVVLGVLLFGLLTSYTRASILSLPIAALYFLVMRLRFTKVVLVAVAVATAFGVVHIATGDNYMEFAPNYERTIFNGKNFEKHLEATYKMQDVSGMERVYRWVAAARMIADKPIVGSGAATFYPEYKRYTIKSFRTYVSDNPEKSTTHNYFLLQLAEQGIPGFLLFLVFIGTALLKAESLYHRSRQQPEVRRVILGATMSFIVIVFHLTLNELVEVDRIGPVFFICVALLIRSESWLAEAQEGEADSSLRA